MDNQNNILWIFQNFKETIDLLPDSKQGLVWKMVVNYGFGGEESIKNDLKKCNSNQKIAFLSIKNLIKLRKKAGSQNGISNNISGLAKDKQPNIAPNITPNIDLNLLKENNNNIIINKKENNIKENKNNNYGELGNVKLTEEQYKTLSDKYTNLDLAIEKLDTWLGTSGSKNKNKNHFAYFKSNSWVWENLKEKTEDVSCTYIQDKEQENLGRLAELTKKKLEEDMLKRFDKKLI